MDNHLRRFLGEHFSVTRRHFVKTGVLSAAVLATQEAFTAQAEQDPRLQQALTDLETWLTLPDDFRDVSRGKPKPHKLDDAKKKEVGLTRDSWKLNVISDTENPAIIKNPLEGDNAFTFDQLMELAKEHAVRFPKVMTCLNIGCPLGNGIWEGVPLREVVWKTQPTENLRRVFYYGYHNDEPKQMFRSSLPVGRILEDPYELPPVILCYKLNGQWLTSERGGPVRIVVPEDYGFKSIKWLTNLVLSNLGTANDTYIEQNNDVYSPLKTFCATLTAPNAAKPDAPIPVTGWAQIGISGLKKVQVWISERDTPLPEDDPNFTRAPWQDAAILPAPSDYGGGYPDGKIPSATMGFDSHGQPESWPLRLTRAHWSYLHPGLPAGRYTLRCRTIDNNGAAQPMPRPFRKSGHAKIETIRFEVV
ncbi:MAG: molybdopterin-dependent oxidoreductase [Fuerstiella sp.]|jgi:DMSO/TMAO reductase YedYZ molybdopterin-dependent catalytic subunit|nr:molybdopterin-dependent oxidoreductase [Fuerstiella sp.]MDG2131018.1 molybdopterin-dependent oxidoreductase [Fuerstiella sp.]